MNTLIKTFYVIGGTLRHDAPSYVVRQADSDVHAGLSAGEFCYVLTARQMGKSSLMVHTAARLRQQGLAVAVLDLTSVGQNLAPDQWYGGLLRSLGYQLDSSGALEEELDAFWLEQEHLGPLQRWMAALREQVLPRVSGRIVVFVDEIDVVRSLPFSTDEFFAAIRACYNSRTEDPAFSRLTFCLLGVASPSDLIRDARMTPFNIGRRIELTDFTKAESAPLARGFLTPPPNLLPETERGSGTGLSPLFVSGRGRGRGSADELLHRILYWTHGHPYLTQRLCEGVAEELSVGGRAEGAARGRAVVDRVCQARFLSPSARERDDNLLFVRQRLLTGEVDPASVLDLYEQVRCHRRVPVDDTNQLVSLLRLSGITRVEAGELRVRNRIYARVFNRAWVVAHTPGAEMRRQRAAYQRGLLRTSAVASVIIVAMGLLMFLAARSESRARESAALARAERDRATHLLYAAQMKVAQQSCEAGALVRARELLAAWRPEPGQEDLRGFEWRYLWRLSQGDQLITLSAHAHTLPGGVVRSQSIRGGVAFSPDGSLLASGNLDATVRLWEVASGRELADLVHHASAIRSVLFSPDGRTVAAGDTNGQVVLWDVASQRALAALPVNRNKVKRTWSLALAWSPDGKTLAASGIDGIVRLWEIPSRHRVPAPRVTAALVAQRGIVPCLAFSPDGRSLAAGNSDGTVTLWDVPSRRERGTLTGHRERVWGVAFSPDGNILATGSQDHTVKLWRLATGQEVATLLGHQGDVRSVGFSPDGKRLATGCDDTSVRLWDVASRQRLTTFAGHQGQVDSVAFSPDGTLLASSGMDRTTRLWSAATRGHGLPLLQQQRPVDSIAYSPDGRIMATGSDDGAVSLWSVASWRRLAILAGSNRAAAGFASAARAPLTPANDLDEHAGVVSGLIFSRDGRRLAGGTRRGVTLWDVPSRRTVATLPGSSAFAPPVALSPDGKLLAWSEGKTVRLWDVASHREIAPLTGHEGPVWGVAFSPDGKILASAGESDTGIRLWEVDGRPPAGSWRALLPLNGSFNSYTPLLFSPDGKTLVTNSELSVRLWDVATRQMVASLSGHTWALGAVAFSPDGKTLAVGGHNTITLWNLAVRQEVATLRGPLGGVRAIAFSPDGRFLASGSADGTIRLWPAASFLEADTLNVVGTGSDRTVRLQWRPLRGVLGYNVYRTRAAGTARSPRQAPLGRARRAELFRLHPRLVTETSFEDRLPGLANGRPQGYAVAPVYPGAANRAVEGPHALLGVIPVPAPPGWQGCSIDEGLVSGSVLFDVPTVKITLRGSGRDLWYSADECYFMCRPVAGDFQITVTTLSRPTGIEPWAKAGVMLRESLEGGARDAHLVITTGRGLAFQWRAATGDLTDTRLQLGSVPQKMPITLRLTRQGDTVSAEYAQDPGKRFASAGDRLVFTPSLARRLYAGLVITSHHSGDLSEATFSGLKIESR